MKKIWLLSGIGCVLFCSAFVKSTPTQQTPSYPDSLRAVYLYTEGLKNSLIKADSVSAYNLWMQALSADSTFAPAYFSVAEQLMYKDARRAMTYARKAYEQDTTNKWYLQRYGQTLLVGGNYETAMEVYKKLLRRDPHEPDNYRVVAMLYQQGGLPYSAIMILDSAENQLGKIQYFSDLKRQLLIGTRQYDKALAEAQEMVEAAPYEPANHRGLAEMYAASGKDSLAMVEFATAMRMDSTDVETLMSLADYYNRTQNFRDYLATTKRLFISDDMGLDSKVKSFKQITSDMRFYRDFYFQINDLAQTLAIKYPTAQSVVELYASHLIASGELEQALVLYKTHAADRPPVYEYYKNIIDIESYKQRIDSVNKYVNEAIALFPGRPELYLSKGGALSYAKRYGEAVKSFKTSLQYAKSDSLKGVIWGLIGDTYHQEAEDTTQRKSTHTKAKKMSYSSYDKALTFDKNNAMVLNNYAYFLSVDGVQLERALEMSSRSLALGDTNPTYIDTYAWILYKLGRYAEAKKSMQQAISLDTRKSPDLQVHYGDILAALGEDFMAEVYWRKALENGYNADEINTRIENLKKK